MPVAMYEQLVGAGRLATLPTGNVGEQKGILTM